ncbi:MAG: GntR family transcriptional regulator [Eubacteriales bacterium]|nr:GntR family transcriptional regulator [Eubacteriales bacterium]
MFTIDVMSRIPVYEQIIKQVEDQILIQLLKAGDKMPSVRSLSVNLGVNPNTIQKAYSELERRHITMTVPGKGSFISEYAAEVISKKSRGKVEKLQEIVRELLLAGITREEIVEAVDEVYEEKKNSQQSYNGTE